MQPANIVWKHHYLKQGWCHLLYRWKNDLYE